MPDAYSFSSIAFHPRASDAQPVVQPGAGLYSERVIPYGNGAILDLGGISAARHYGPIELVFAPADVAAFESLYQTSGALTVNGVAYDRATLISMKNKTVTPHSDRVVLECEFVIG